MPERLNTADQPDTAAEDDIRRDYGPAGCATSAFVLVLGTVFLMTYVIEWVTR